MSRVRFTKIATPSNPPANTAEVYYDTAGTGYNTPAMIGARDESGNLANLANFGVLSYRFLKKTMVTASGAGTWTPQNGCRLAVVTCVGGGAGGGGAATSSTQVSVGGGGGAGAISISTLTGAAIKSTSFSVGALGAGGANGATGTAGTDTTWDTTVIVAKGGSGGTCLAAGTTLIHVVGGVGGLASASTGDIKINGGNGGSGMRFGTTQGFGGDGAGSPIGGNGVGGGGGSTPAGGDAGLAATAGQWGAGGGGGGTNGTQCVGGAGIAGCIIIDEYA